MLISTTYILTGIRSSESIHWKQGEAFLKWCAFILIGLSDLQKSPHMKISHFYHRLDNCWIEDLQASHWTYHTRLSDRILRNTATEEIRLCSNKIKMVWSNRIHDQLFLFLMNYTHLGRTCSKSQFSLGKADFYIKRRNPYSALCPS